MVHQTDQHERRSFEQTKAHVFALVLCVCERTELVCGTVVQFCIGVLESYLLVALMSLSWLLCKHALISSPMSHNEG